MADAREIHPFEAPESTIPRGRTYQRLRQTQICPILRNNKASDSPDRLR